MNSELKNKKNRAHIAVLPGDGVGPEVTAEALCVLRAVAELCGLELTTTSHAMGGAGVDATGEPLPKDTLAACQAADAVLLGAVGGPRWDGEDRTRRPEAGLLALRKELGLFANVRPLSLMPELAGLSPLRPERLLGVDFVLVRELTGGIYFGAKRRQGDQAEDVCSYSAHEIERVIRVAAHLARSRKGHLISIDKANVLETSRLWREVACRVVEQEFPDITLEHMLVDAAAMHMLRDPGAWDVVVTENMFGDILSDEASMLAGSLGLLPSASLGAAGKPGLFEPIHGSAPDIAGQDRANPCGTILSVAMLLRHSLGQEEAACAIEKAVAQVLADGVRTADLNPLDSSNVVGTKALGAAVIEALPKAWQSTKGG